MTDTDLHTLGPQLTAYLRRFHLCFVQQRTTDHLHTYCRGLLSDLPRKSVEPLALTAGTPVRTLQDFLRDYTWEATAVRDQLHAPVADLLPCILTPSSPPRPIASLAARWPFAVAGIFGSCR